MCSSRGGRHATIVILCNPLLAISTDESAVIKAPYVSTRDPPLHPHHPHHCHIQLFMSWLQLIELDGWLLLGEQIWHILIFHLTTLTSGFCTQCESVNSAFTPGSTDSAVDVVLAPRLGSDLNVRPRRWIDVFVIRPLVVWCSLFLVHLWRTT